jgi:DNA repair protein SbcD/Mre11
LGIKLLHTSDLHLGSKFRLLGKNAERYRRQLVKTFEKIVDIAIQNNVDIFMIAGDLFDKPTASTYDTASLIDSISKLTASGIYVIMIAGNHDRLTQDCIYNRPEIKNINSDLFKFFYSDEPEQWYIAKLDATIHGASVVTAKQKTSQLKMYSKNDNSKYNIGLIHGSVDLSNEPDNYPIYQEDLKNLDYNYLALGDWHGLLEINKKAWYCGSPEVLSIGQKNSGYVLLVDIDDNKTNVEPIYVASKKIIQLEIDISGYTDLNFLHQEIKKYNGVDTILSITLTGRKNLILDIDLEGIIDYHSNKFFYITIADNSKLQISQDVLYSYPETFIIGKYIRLLQSKKNDDEENNRLIDEAIQLGVSLLEGKKNEI